MGWKASLFIVSGNTGLSDQEVLSKLGFDKTSPLAENTFDAVINPPDGQVYIGNYNGNLIICSQEIPNRIFERRQKEARELSDQFPGSELCALMLHSVVNAWGYSVIRDGRMLRERLGDADNGTLVDQGEPLPEELSLLALSSLDENGNRVYSFEDDPDEELSEDQVGEDFVFAVSKRYFGQALDQTDDGLFETSFRGYSLGSTAKESQSKSMPNWVTILIIFGLVLTVQLIRRCS